MPENDEKRKLWIVAHIRVPEDFCDQEWKDANSVQHFLDTFRLVQAKLLEVSSTSVDADRSSDDLKHTTLIYTLDIYTEACFSKSQELELRQVLQDDSRVVPFCLTVHRQTPLLPCVQAMATADIFIPASSFLSAFAAFYQTSLIVLPNETTRHDKYFLPHLRHSKTKKDASIIESLCKLVRVEDDETLTRAISELISAL